MGFANRGTNSFVALSIMGLGVFFHSFVYANDCSPHNSAIKALAHRAFLAKRVIVGPRTKLDDYERRALEAVVRVNQANGLLLADCKTVITAAHISQSPVDGKLLKEAKVVYHQGKGSDRSEVIELFESGAGKDWANEREKAAQWFLSYEDWNILRLKNKKTDKDGKCSMGIEPAYVSKKRLRELAKQGKVFSVGVSPPTGNGFAASPEDIVDYNQIVIRGGQIVDAKNMSKTPVPEDLKDMLWHTSYGKMNDSGHIKIVEIDKKVYAVATYLGPAQHYCDESAENIATGCPAESIWITDENPYGKAIIKAMRQSDPSWKMKRFL